MGNKEIHKLLIIEDVDSVQFSLNVYEVAMHNRIHDSVYIDLAVYSVMYMYSVYVHMYVCTNGTCPGTAHSASVC